MFETSNRRTNKRRAKKNGIRWCILQKIQTSKSIDFLHFFAKRKKSVEKMIHQKKN